MSDQGEAAALWQFSLDLYADPDIETELLRLQDHHGFDINHLLAGLFAGLVLGVRLSQPEIAGLREAAADWTDTVILPLRATRRALKHYDDEPNAASMRTAVKALELEAERQAQRLLAARLPRSTPKTGSWAAAEGNLRDLADGQGGPLLALVARCRRVMPGL